MAQIATQGHVGKQTLSMEQLLTQFLNTNRVCIEHSQKFGWHTENEMWQTAVESTRRMDTDFDLEEHLKHVTSDNVVEGKRALEESCITERGATKNPTGKGTGTPVAYTTPTAGAPQYIPRGGKGVYKGKYGKDVKGKYGKS